MHWKSALLVSGLLAAPAAAQSALPFPLVPDGADARTGVTRLATQAIAVDALSGRDAVVLSGVPLPGGPASVSLSRIRHETMRFGYQVDGVPAPDLLDGASLSVWRGSVLGAPDSEVLLSFSHAGSRGWVRANGELVHFLPQTDASGSWFDGPVFVATEQELRALGAEPDLSCGLEELGDEPTRDAVPAGPGSPGSIGSKSSGAEGAATLYGCAIAIETDWQLNQVFGGNLTAETAYVTTLWAAVSARYVEQLSTALSFPYVQFYTSSSDPWSAPETGDSIDMLYEFQASWNGNVPAGARIGHFVSGAGLGGGVAWLDILCDSAQDYTFAVSGNIDGDVPFPIAVGPLNWDFIVTSHETGHNFGTPHTHDYCPPIDQCAPSGYFGACQSAEVCTSSGTIMSYCHLCSGGTSNVTTFFHPQVVSTLLPFVESCLDPVSAISATPPSLITPGATTNLVATVAGTPVGSVGMSYRFEGSASFTQVAMTPQGSGVFGATLPAAQCGDQPEVFFSFTESTFGPQATPVFALEVGNVVTLFADDCESDLGWTEGIPGDDASSGIWVRGDPLGTAAQPEAGAPAGVGSSCYFTGQGPSGGGVGDNDVDGGVTTLVTPTLDLSGGDARIGYWRWFSNDAGASPEQDEFDVEVSNGGAWTSVETVGPSGPEASGGWYYHEFLVSDFVAPTANVQVRFRASDEGGGSIVEAAIDELRVFQTSCDVCQTDLGFGGPGSATLSLCGPVLKSGSSATLAIDGGPAGQPAWIGYATTSSPVSVLGGTLVPWPIVGVLATSLDGAGAASLQIPGGALAPTSIYLQGLILDAGGSFLITNALEGTFLP